MFVLLGSWLGFMYIFFLVCVWPVLVGMLQSAPMLVECGSFAVLTGHGTIKMVAAKERSLDVWRMVSSNFLYSKSMH